MNCFPQVSEDKDDILTPSKFHLDSDVQIPISWYFDPEIARAEQNLIFARSARFIGHTEHIPLDGNYRVLPRQANAEVLLRDGQEPRLLSNLCRHRHAPLLEGTGTISRIVCPLHQWTYEKSGLLRAAPKFDKLPTCSNIRSAQLQKWNNFLFAGNRNVLADLDSFSPYHDLATRPYVFHRSTECHYPFNWKVYIDGFAEDYHVGPCHPGLGGFVEVQNLKWQHEEWASAQIIPIKARESLKHEGRTHVYRDWQKCFAEHFDRTPSLNVCWILYYPNIMIEYHPGFLVISTIEPRGVSSCDNFVEFYHDREIFEENRDLVELAEASYLETAAEDEAICYKMSRGLESLHLSGQNQSGPFHPQLEAGLYQWHKFLRTQIHTQKV